MAPLSESTQWLWDLLLLNALVLTHDGQKRTTDFKLLFEAHPDLLAQAITLAQARGVRLTNDDPALLAFKKGECAHQGPNAIDLTATTKSAP